MRSFVHLDPDEHIDIVLEAFARFRDAESLASLLRPALERYATEIWFDAFLESLCANLEQRAPASASKDAVLLAAAATALEVCDSAWRIDQDALRSTLVDQLVLAELDLTAAFAAVAGADPRAAIALLDSGIAGDLVVRELVDPAELVDRAALRTLEQRHDGGRQMEPSYGGHRKLTRFEFRSKPTRLEYWCEAALDQVIPTCTRLAASEPIETLGALGRGMMICLSVGSPYHVPNPDRGEPSLPPIDVAPLAQALCKRRRTQNVTDDQILTTVCWRIATDLGARAAECLREDHPPLCEHALEALGRMRTSFDDPRHFKAQWPYLTAAITFWLETQPKRSLWEILRRLLLGFRRLPALALPPDLRTWVDSGEPLPEPWSWVPARISWLFERYIARELDLDKDLVELRRIFAQYCLDRIKSKERGGKELVEPHPHWRCACIHAARELHAGLGIRGHRVLAWSQINDPEPKVREVAALAEDFVRREQSLPDHISPRRAIYAAYWWLRQAHVLALAGHVDEKGSHETFRKEVRRQPSKH